MNRNDATAILRPEGRAQVYKRVPVEWAGRISKPTETDVRFDLDLWDGRTQAPADQPVKWVMLLQPQALRHRARESADECPAGRVQHAVRARAQ